MSHSNAHGTQKYIHGYENTCIPPSLHNLTQCICSLLCSYEHRGLRAVLGSLDGDCGGNLRPPRLVFTLCLFLCVYLQKTQDEGTDEESAGGESR